MRALLSCVLIFIFLSGCGTDDSAFAPEAAAFLSVETYLDNGNVLWVKNESSEPQALLSDGMSYQTFLSPDKHWLLVEMQLLSNLVIIELFVQGEDQWKRQTRDINTELWEKFSDSYAVELEHLESTRLSFLSWEQEGRALFEMSAWLPDDRGWTGKRVALNLTRN